MNEVLTIIKNRAGVRLSMTDICLCLWYVYVVSSALTSTDYPCYHTVSGATYMLSLYLALRIVFTASHIGGKYVMWGIIMWSVYELGYGVMQLVEGSSNHYLYPMTGTFLNPGPYSASLAIALVLLCQYLKETGDGIVIYKGVTSRHAVELLTMCFVVILPSTWSRAALFSVAFCLVLIYWDVIRRRIWWFAGAGVVACVVMYIAKSGSAHGRLAVNYIAAHCLMDNPLTGGGIGSFFHSYAEKTAELSAAGLAFDPKDIDVLEYAFNDLLLTGVEQGVVGLALCLALLLLVFRSLWNKSRALAYGLLSLLIFSLFSYPFELLPYQIVAVIIMAYSATDDKGVRINAAVVGVVSVVLALLPWDYSMAKQKAEDDYRMIAGITEKAFVNDYYELLPLLEDNRNFLFDFGKMLSVQGRYNDSNAMLRKGTLISNDPMFYVLQGNNYKQMGLNDKAEAMYRKAYLIMPNRLYPLYKLMLLYKDNNDRKGMKAMATRVLNFQEKVKSPATREMKKEAKQIIEEKNE